MSNFNLSAIILTFNEEKNIEACLQSLAAVTDEIFLVDSGSRDQTLEIGKKFTDKICSHTFETHAKQWNWAFQNLPISGDWVLALDADQRVTPELVDEIRHVLPKASPEIDGFYLRRRQIFRNRWIRHGGYYPKYLLKLFRRGKGRSDENELLDFRFYVPGKTATLQHDLIEDNQKDNDLGVWKAKHMHFAGLQAKEEFSREKNGTAWSIKPSLTGTPDQRTLFLKNLWYRMPLYVRPFLYFFYRYFLRLGFLDGKEGFIFHFYQGLWYRILVDIRLGELRKKARESLS